jgi:hypothetical protein
VGLMRLCDSINYISVAARQGENVLDARERDDFPDEC